MGMDLAFALRGYEISNTAKVIYGVLEGLSRASAAKGLPYTYIGQRAIAERVGVCEKTVRSSLKQLKAAKLILVKRRGQGLNNAIYVLSPTMTAQEKEVKTVSFLSRTEKKSHSNINPKRDIKNIDSKTIYPQKDVDAASPQDKGRTASKGRPTNKRPSIKVEERQIMKKKYKEYLYHHLKVDEFRGDFFTSGEECEALEKIIELIANTMAGKGKIMVGGSLLSPQQWWYMVKNISQNTIIDLIYQLREARNVKNMRAYLLASLYNAAMEETIQKPWYSTAY